MVTVKTYHTVKPAGETPSGVMTLPETDQFLSVAHIILVCFYKSPTVSDLSLSEITHLLTTSLSRALSVFYPLVGRLHLTSHNRLQLNLNPVGALFLEAESDKTVEDFGDFCPTPEIRELIPSVDYTRPIHEIPLLIVQLTKFACGGVSVGLGIHHTICDGKAALHFVSEWARICRGESPENLPFLDRSVMNLGKTSEQVIELVGPDPVLMDGPGPEEERLKETSVVMLKLSKDQIGRLKTTANQDSSEQSKPFSRYEVLAAHIWRCASIARHLKDEQPTRVFMGSNFRNKIDIPLPEKYFGNAVIVVTTDAITKDLLLQSLGYAAGKVREGLNNVTNEYVRSFITHLRKVEDFNKTKYFHFLGSSRSAFRGNPNFEIVSWFGLTNDGVDFGWGKEIYMGPGQLGSDGKALIFPNYANDDGSLRVALRLQTAHMDAFTKLFYQNLSNV